MAEIIQEALDILNNPDYAREKRIKKMVALYKYRFRWSRKTFFNKVITDWIPEIKEDISAEAQRTYNTKILFAAMELGHMNIVLNKLELIENANKRRRASGNIGNSD